MAQNAEIYFPLGNDLFLTKCVFQGTDYFHIWKFKNINHRVRPTRTGVVLNIQQIRCLKNLLNRHFKTTDPDVDSTKANSSIPVSQPMDSQQNSMDADAFDVDFFLKYILGSQDPQQTSTGNAEEQPSSSALADDSDDEMLLKAVLDAEKSYKLEKLERRFFE